MRAEQGPVPGALGSLAAALFGAVVTRRNARFNAGKGVIHPPIPVISVGNLSVGGVGKTPMVQRLARTLQNAGHRPAVLLRGYGARAGGVSDEAEEHRAALPGVRIVVNPDRVSAVRALATLEPGARPTCVILDDGFQHRRLGRALDLVLIDATRSPWRDRLLPAGWLREPPASLARAHAVVLTHADRAEPAGLAALRAHITAAHGKPPVALTRHTWESVRVESRAHPGENNEERSISTEDPAWLGARRVGVACAIGEPEQFLAMVRGQGAEILATHIRRDHAGFGARPIAALASRIDTSRGDVILTTGKDRRRLLRAIPAGYSGLIAYPVLSIGVIEGAAELDRVVVAAADADTTDLGTP